MKKTIIALTATLILGALGFQSCKNEKEDTVPQTQQPAEFIADNSTFSGFEGWYKQATKQGVDPANLGQAHAGNDSTSVRNIYFTSSTVSRSGGEFPVGTIVAKKTAWAGNGGGSMITAMAKRGNNFDATGNNWEYFILNPDGSIVVDNGNAMRGANLMNGACKSCHGKVAGNDYIFTK